MTEEYPHIFETRHWERYRGMLFGAIRTVHRGIVLVVAIRYFDAGQTEKALLAGAFTFGLLFTPFILNFVARNRIPVTKAASHLFLGSAISYALAAAIPSFTAYFWGMLLGLAFCAAATPLITALWRQNVSGNLRGQFFSWIIMLGIITSIPASLVAAWWVERDVSLYQPLVGILAVFALLASYTIRQIPSTPPQRRTRNPLANLSYLWKDRTFGYISIAWR